MPYRPKTLTALTAVALSLSAPLVQAGEESFELKTELANEYLKDLLDPSIQLFWGGDTLPGAAELTRTDVFTSTSVSLSPFGGGRKHCVDAFQKTLKSLVDTAKAQGYDAVVQIRHVQGGKPSEVVASFKCSPGYKVTTVSLSGAFAMSPQAAAKAAEAEQQSLELPARKPAEGAVFLPAQPLLDAPEAKAALGSEVSIHWGLQAPAFAFRYGPDDYYDDAEIGPGGVEVACRQALVKTLVAVVKEAKEKAYNAVIKVRSRLNEAYAPNPAELECLVAKKKVSVTVQVTLAQLKP
jgi:uncharacterized protein YbjQ (UPF0145 family)